MGVEQSCDLSAEPESESELSEICSVLGIVYYLFNVYNCLRGLGSLKLLWLM